jgi:hypothetical protein
VKNAHRVRRGSSRLIEFIPKIKKNLGRFGRDHWEDVQESQISQDQSSFRWISRKEYLCCLPLPMHPIFFSNVRCNTFLIYYIIGNYMVKRLLHSRFTDDLKVFQVPTTANIHDRHKCTKSNGVLGSL